MTNAPVPPLESRKRVFSAVFPTSSSASSLPTPSATPDSSFTLPGQAFGVLPASSVAPSFVHDQIQWDRAWHTATSYLCLGNGIPGARDDAAEPDHAFQRLAFREPRAEESQAISYVLSSSPPSKGVAAAAGANDLMQWYTHEVRRHFLAYVLPYLTRVLIDDDDDRGETKLIHFLQRLQLVQSFYLRPLVQHVLPLLFSSNSQTMDPDRWDRLKVHIAALERRFKRDLHAIVAFSTPQEALSHLLQDVLSKDIHIVLEIPAQEAANDELQSDDEDMADYLPPEQRAFFRDVEARVGLLLTGYKTRSDCFIQSDKPKVAASRRKILHIFRALEDIGLGGEKGQRVFADMMHRVMSEYVYMRFSNQWHSPSRVPRDIRDWVEENFARLTVEVLHHPDPQDTSNKQASSTAEMCDPSISHRDVTKWQDMVIGRLGRLRVSQLFDVVVDYDHSKGAVEDLKTYVATPSTRARLVSSFTSTISQRLLHPGAPTVQILEFYVSLIRAFSFLDPKGVLLDRVARPIRRYIKDRDDTVKVIVLGLQAEVENPDPDAPRTSDDMWVLDYLATELLRTPQLVNNRGDDEGELDWDDMGWTPDPVDAGPDYRKSKVSDVVGSLISIFEPKDVFVKEIQKVMGERLIKKEIDSVSETRLLELLKLRFGESALQPCEVMLRDVKESKSIDRNICSDQKMHLSKEDSTDPARSSNPVPELHAKILSRLFWPELQDQSFNVPTEIVELQARYEQGFEKLKQSRKLTWLNSLGRVTVELEFDDRVITEDVQTWQACVIYAFQTPDSSQGDRDVIRTVLDLMTELEMDESLVRNALTFWVGKRVLHQVAPDTYAVLETLSSSTLDPDGAMAGEEEAATARAAADAATTASAMSGALKSADDIATSKMHVYWQFIVGMLTNGGPMPLAQMVMMLRMTVGGTTEFGEEDLRDFLGGMVREGKLEVVGGRYKIVG